MLPDVRNLSESFRFSELPRTSPDRFAQVRFGRAPGHHRLGDDAAEQAPVTLFDHLPVGVVLVGLEVVVDVTAARLINSIGTLAQFSPIFVPNTEQVFRL